MLMAFASSWAWYLMLLVFPAAWGALWWQQRRTAAFLYGNTLALRQVPSGWLSRLWWLPGALRVACIATLVVAIARPQEPNRQVVSTKGVDIVVCLDMSASMNAVDMSGDQINNIQMEGDNPNNRFDVARELLIEFIKNRAEAGDRIALILFGGGAYLKFPLTNDYRRAIQDIKELRLDDGRRTRDDVEACMNDCTISGAMTTIGDALKRGFLRLRDTKGKDRSIILITDGDDRGSKTAPKEVARFLADWANEEEPETGEKLHRPIPIYTFLVGGGEQTWMPKVDPFSLRRERIAGGLLRYRRAEGQYPANPGLLAEIAGVSGGQSYQSYNEEDFREHFKNLEETVYKRQITNFPTELFTPWLMVALGFLLFELLLRLTLLRKFP